MEYLFRSVASGLGNRVTPNALSECFFEEVASLRALSAGEPNFNVDRYEYFFCLSKKNVIDDSDG